MKNTMESEKKATLFGKDLATLVAERLETCPLMHRHKEYSGMGLIKQEDGTYAYGEVVDSRLLPIKEFSSREDFIQWLAKQSDESLSQRQDGSIIPNDQGQVITQGRLAHYVKYSIKSTAGDF